jgi:molybdenum-dependent DNA-binding transcriptional regulator ModE
VTQRAGSAAPLTARGRHQERKGGGMSSRAELSEWLQLMLAEIARKQEELERARLESELRAREQNSDDP